MIISNSGLDILCYEETVTEQTRIWGERVERVAEKPMGREVLILARRGPVRDSLRSLLETAPWIEAVRVVEDTLSAFIMVTLHRPALVIVVDDLPADGLSALLRWIKTEGSYSRFLVLAEDSRQREQALSLGADTALLKGFPAADLFRVIEKLVTRPYEPDGSRLP